MLNIPKGKIFTRQQIYQLCYDRYLMKNMFRELIPNGKPFEQLMQERHIKAIIFAVQNTNDWYYTQSQIKEW